MSHKIILGGASELPLFAVSMADMSFNTTGSWRYLQPIQEEKLAPCRLLCPVGTDIPRVLALVAEGELEKAYSKIRRTNPLPAICGRVCYHPCESRCTRRMIDDGLAIQAIERRVSEVGLDISEEPVDTVTSKRVAVIGSGPAGLSCAYYLARSGVPVHVYESASALGGMLRLGIPPYRLPRSILDREIQRIRDTGVHFVTDCRIGKDRSLDDLKKQYAAVFVASGAHRSRSLPFSSAASSVFSGLEFLRAVHTGRAPVLGRITLIVGGGNTAVDAARVALRLGSEPIVVYRRSVDEMPAHPQEVEEATREGVDFLFLASPQAVSVSGSKLAVSFVEMELGSADQSGRRRPLQVPDSTFVLEADSLIVAVGEEPEVSFLNGGENETPVLLGGDAATGPSTVVEAILSGRNNAIQILAHLGVRESAVAIPKMPQTKFEPETLNRAYFSPLAGLRTASIPLSERKRSFDEVVLTVDHSQALSEAARCLSCGVCSQCDNCWTYCPEGAVFKTPSGYDIDLTYCKGCGICAEECPRGVIRLEEQE